MRTKENRTFLESNVEGRREGLSARDALACTLVSRLLLEQRSDDHRGYGVGKVGQDTVKCSK